MKRVLTAIVAASALLGTAAHATTMTTSITKVTFGPGPTDYTNASEALPLFNSSLGSLVAVTISGTYGFSSSVTVTNNNSVTGSSGTVNTVSAGEFGSSTSSINAVFQNLLNIYGSVQVDSAKLAQSAFYIIGTQATYDLGASGTATVSSNSPTTRPQSFTAVADSDNGFTTSDLQAFEAAGGGTFNVLFNTITGTLLGNTGGNTTADQRTNATATISISYTYDKNPVPEPASIALLGAGILGVGAFRRTRR